MHRRFTCVGMEIQMDCVISSQPLGHQGYVFRGKELTHEPCIRFSDGKRRYSLQNVRSPKCLGNESLSIPSEFHQLIDEQLHRMDPTSRSFVSSTALRQQDMIHPSSKQNRVVHAHGNAGTEQRV
jgi:hypothetical protein